MAEWFQTNGAMVQTIALIVTLVVLICYTIETSRLRRTTVKQTVMGLRPCIHLQGKNYVNIGHSPALNITIEPLELNVLTLDFHTTNLLEPGKARQVKFTAEGRNQEADEIMKILGHGTVDFPYFKELKVQKYILRILYENMDNQKFYTEVIVYCNLRRVQFIKTKKV